MSQPFVIQIGAPADDPSGIEPPRLQNGSVRLSAPALDAQAPLAWASWEFHRNIVERVKHVPQDSKQPDSYRVRLADMQRMRIQRLQIKLATHARRIYDNSISELDQEWEVDLKEYIQAIKDHDYMQSRGDTSPDPFLISGVRAVDREVLDAAFAGFSPPAHDGPNTTTTREPWRTERQSPVLTRGENRARFWKRGLLERMLVAAIGAAFLIVPMWLLVLVLRTPADALGCTTAFISVFGLLMALRLPDNNSVLSATAGYAAVLVVFVALVVDPEAS